MRDRIYIETITQITWTVMQAIAIAIIAIAFIAAGFFVWYFTFKAKQEERRFLIEKGYKPEDLPSSSFTFPWRKTGIVLVGAMLGVVLNGLTFNHPDAVLPALILGAGIGMILAQAFDNGYPARAFLRTLLYGFLGFSIAGIGVSIADSMAVVHDGLMVFLMLASVGAALLIERSTRKA